MKKYDIKTFIEILAIELIEPFIRFRLEECQLSDLLRFQMENFVDTEPKIQFNLQNYRSREKECFLCEGENTNCCKYVCADCSAHICDNHRTITCSNCT